MRAAAYEDGLAAAHADISLRLAKQAAENNVHLNKTVIMMDNSAIGMQKERESAARFLHSASFVVAEAARKRILARAVKSGVKAAHFFRYG